MKSVIRKTPLSCFDFRIYYLLRVTRKILGYNPRVQISIASRADEARYRTWFQAQPGATLWQSLEWKAYQEKLGRETKLFVLRTGDAIKASALIIIDRGSFRLSTWDCPRGPIGSGAGTKELIEHIASEAKKSNALALYVSPVKTFQELQAWSISPRKEQPEATLIIDLKPAEEDILKQMHPKGRYNIGIAKKHGITIEESEDIGPYWELTQETAARDGFQAKSKHHYRTFLHGLAGSFLLYARHGKEETPVAGLLGVFWKDQAIYYYGASSGRLRQAMAPYLLQWAAMQKAKHAGMKSYDLLGISPTAKSSEGPELGSKSEKRATRNEEPLSASVRHAGWAGITEFKRKFGGRIIAYPPEHQKILRPFLYYGLEWKRKVTKR